MRSTKAKKLPARKPQAIVAGRKTKPALAAGPSDDPYPPENPVCRKAPTETDAQIARCAEDAIARTRLTIAQTRRLREQLARAFERAAERRLNGSRQTPQNSAAGNSPPAASNSDERGA